MHFMSTPEVIRATCLGHHARMAARALTRHYNAYLRPVNLTAGQFGLLVALEAQGTRLLAQIADELGMDASTLARGIQDLERRGLIEARGGRGRGGKRAVLTPAGCDLLARATPLWRTALATVVDALGGQEEADSTLDCLSKLIEAAQTSDL